MTRKDYVATAEILKAFEENENLDTEFLISAFTKMFQNDNERFDTKRFADAVYGGK